MRNVTDRIAKLENRLGIAAGKPKLRFVICQAGWGQALDIDRCTDILSECDSFPMALASALLTFFIYRMASMQRD